MNKFTDKFTDKFTNKFTNKSTSVVNKFTRVVNKYKEPYDIYIGRGGKWGNPFVIGRDGDRDEVISLYAKYLKDSIKNGVISIDELCELDGKVLGCFCKPERCHGDVLVKAVKWAVEKKCGRV